MTVLIVVVAVIAVVVVLPAMKRFVFHRARDHDCCAARLGFPPIIDFRAWPRWSSFETIDPALQRIYSGAATGQGATIYEWIGNSRAGMGRMEVTNVAPPRRATVRVAFVKPFVAHNINEFVLDPN
ncbi:MAG TPA: hypothetical protein VHV78_08940, partial [Gemmatimonadaceae bacterium]|nr:hypothetical protein [Gemmatimonadaceae bacterium]